MEPDNPTWLVSMGESHANLGDLIDALGAYQKAATLAPDDPGYWRLLAIFCAQNNVNVAARKAKKRMGSEAIRSRRIRVRAEIGQERLEITSDALARLTPQAADGQQTRDILLCSIVLSCHSSRVTQHFSKRTSPRTRR